MTKKLSKASAHRARMREAGYRSKEVLLHDKHHLLIEEIQSEQGHSSQRETFEFVLNEYAKLKRYFAEQQMSHGDQQVSG